MKSKHHSDLPSKAEIFDYWKDKFSSKAMFIDWGEPSCWACDWHWNGRYDVNDSDATIEKILKAWENTPLQRCHIVPRSLNGSSHPSNLFLMCSECHDLAPNTTNPEIFFAWVRKQSWLNREMKKLKSELEIWNITDAMIPKLIKTFESEDFKAWGKANIGIHFPQSGYSSTFSRITLSSVLGLLLAYLKQNEFSNSI